MRHRATLRPIVGIALAALLIIYADVQQATAAASAKIFTTKTEPLREIWDDFDRFFREAAARASQLSEPVVLPDGTVRLALREWKLSQTAVVLYPDGLDEVSFVPPTNIDAEQKAELLEWLEHSESHVGQLLFQVIEDRSSDARATSDRG